VEAFVCKKAMRRSLSLRALNLILKAFEATKYLSRISSDILALYKRLYALGGRELITQGLVS
jgi:hypothetical protein